MSTTLSPPPPPSGFQLLAELEDRGLLVHALSFLRCADSPKEVLRAAATCRRVAAAVRALWKAALGPVPTRVARAAFTAAVAAARVYRECPHYQSLQGLREIQMLPAEASAAAAETVVVRGRIPSHGELVHLLSLAHAQNPHLPRPPPSALLPLVIRSLRVHIPPFMLLPLRHRPMTATLRWGVSNLWAHLVNLPQEALLVLADADGWIDLVPLAAASGSPLPLCATMYLAQSVSAEPVPFEAEVAPTAALDRLFPPGEQRLYEWLTTQFKTIDGPLALTPRDDAASANVGGNLSCNNIVEEIVFFLDRHPAPPQPASPQPASPQPASPQPASPQPASPQPAVLRITLELTYRPEESRYRPEDIETFPTDLVETSVAIAGYACRRRTAAGRTYYSVPIDRQVNFSFVESFRLVLAFDDAAEVLSSVCSSWCVRALYRSVNTMGMGHFIASLPVICQLFNH